MDFFKLRPSTNTAAAIAEALDRAKAAQADTQHCAEVAKQSRDNLLLDGEPGALAAAETALVTARDDIDRAQAVVTQLEARHAIAERTEWIGKADAAVNAAATADAELRRWWEKNEAGLRRILSEGHRLTVAVTNARASAARLDLLTRQQYPDAEFVEMQNTPRDHLDWPEAVVRLIELGMTKPKETVAPAAVVHDDAEHAAPVPAGPGVLAQGQLVQRSAGSLSVTYGGQHVLTEESSV